MMNSPATQERAPNFLGTFTVAKILGVSVGTVQALVQRGDLKGWKTKGGHRRISLESVKKYQQICELQNSRQLQSNALRVLVVDDDPVFLSLIEETTASWNLNIELVLLSSAVEALLRIGELQPHVLFSDLNMPGVDGFEFLNKLRQTPQYDPTHLVAVTNMSQVKIAEHGGLPPNVMLQKKPLDMRWLQGFVSALLMEKDLQAPDPC